MIHAARTFTDLESLQPVFDRVASSLAYYSGGGGGIINRFWTKN